MHYGQFLRSVFRLRHFGRFGHPELDRWAARIKTGEDAVSASKATGASAHLTGKQRDIAGGWVLSQNLHGIPVHRLQ